MNSQNIGLKFGIEKCHMLIMRSGKRQLIKRIGLPSKEKFIIRGEKETYNFLGILETGNTKQVEMIEKNSKKGERENFRNQALL